MPMPEWLQYLFLALFSGYVAETIYTHFRHGGRRTVSAVKVLFQLPLFFIALYMALHFNELNRRIVSLLELGPGLVFGHLIFVVSVFATHGSWRDCREILTDIGGLKDFFITNPNLVFRTIQLAFTEELIYRAALQTLLVLWWGPAAAILATALLFALSHEHVFQNTWRETAEFTAFSLLLGSVYYLTTSLAAVIAIHAVRNFEIAWLEFCARAVELDDEAAAQLELDKKYRQESAIPA
jgi:membrane protease YdiL (CAAX protease family)